MTLSAIPWFIRAAMHWYEPNISLRMSHIIYKYIHQSDHEYLSSSSNVIHLYEYVIFLTTYRKPKSKVVSDIGKHVSMVQSDAPHHWLLEYTVYQCESYLHHVVSHQKWFGVIKWYQTILMMVSSVKVRTYIAIVMLNNMHIG